MTRTSAVAGVLPIDPSAVITIRASPALEHGKASCNLGRGQRGPDTLRSLSGAGSDKDTQALLMPSPSL